MPKVTVRYYQNTASDGNHRTVSGGRSVSFASDTFSSTGIMEDPTSVMPPAPSGSAFFSIETDTNIRFTVSPENQAVPTAVDESHSCFPASAFQEQGAVKIDAGSVLNVRFY